MYMPEYYEERDKEEAAKTEAHLERMKKELEELSERMGKLAVFTGTETFKALERMDRFLLEEQYYYMRQYERILKERLERSNKKED